MVEKPKQDNEPKKNFHDNTYLIATALDPRYKFFWLEHTNIDENRKIALIAQVKNDIKTQCIEFESNSIQATQSQASDNNSTRNQPLSAQAAVSTQDSLEPILSPTKKRKLFSYPQKKPNDNCQSKSIITIESHIKQYFDLDYDENVDTVSFWATYSKVFPHLFKLAEIYLSIPCSSSPVERLFSVSGYILRPHRANISTLNLERTTLIKANFYVVQNAQTDALREEEENESENL